MQPIDTTGALSFWEPDILSLAIFGVTILIFVASRFFVVYWLGEMEKSIEKS